jgi:hypothetical protein
MAFRDCVNNKGSKDVHTCFDFDLPTNGKMKPKLYARGNQKSIFSKLRAK